MLSESEARRRYPSNTPVVPFNKDKGVAVNPLRMFNKQGDKYAKLLPDPVDADGAPLPEGFSLVVVDGRDKVQYVIKRGEWKRRTVHRNAAL